jgi:hypothetical protein
MAFLAGKSADVVIGVTSYKFREWRATMRGDIIDTTNFGSSGYRENIAGLVGASITLRGLHDSTAMAFTVGTSYTLILKSSASVSYTVSARLETIETGTTVEGAVEAVLTFQSTGSFTAAIA